MGQDSTFFRGILDKMQSKGLKKCPRNIERTVLEALGLHLIQDPSEKGGDLTLYPGYVGSDTGASWEYCFSRYPWFVTNRGDHDSTVFQDTPVCNALRSLDSFGGPWTASYPGSLGKRWSLYIIPRFCWFRNRGILGVQFFKIPPDLSPTGVILTVLFSKIPRFAPCW